MFYDYIRLNKLYSYFSKNITRDIDKKYLWLVDIIKEVTEEFIIEPSIKITNNKHISMNRYSVLIPNYQDVLIILKKLNIISCSKIYKFVINGMLNDADCILGIDNNKFKIYLDYGKNIDALIINQSSKDHIYDHKEYIVINSCYNYIALKYSYLFMLNDPEIPIDPTNWRHVYKVKNSEYHISLIKPIKWNGYRVYLIGITENSITLYHR